MSKFEIDDNVEIINVNFLTKHERSTFNVKIGDKGKIIGFYKPSPVFAIVANNNFTNSNAGEGKLFVPVSSLQKLNSFYLESNRYKLSQAIKSTGFHAEKLSLETGHAKTYFAGFIAESRFNRRGDITEDRLNSLLTTLAFAERELLGVGAKAIDDNELSFKDYPLYDSTVDYPAEAKVNHNGEIKFAVSIKGEEIKKAISEKVGEVKKDLDKYIDYHKQPKLSNFTKVGIIAIVILLLILIVKNLVV